MNKKLLIITLPIVISIIGIIWFQLDWVSKTYTYELKKMNALADTALRRAIIAIDLEQHDSVSNFLIPKLKIFTDSVNLTFSTNQDSLIVKLNNNIKFQIEDYSLERTTFGVERIEIGYPVQNMFSKIMSQRFDSLDTSPSGEKMMRRMLNEFKVNTGKLSEIITPFYKIRDSLYYKSDSLKIKQNIQKQLFSLGVEASVQIYFFKGESIQLKNLLAMGSLIKEYKPQGMSRYTGERRWVGVYFKSRDQYLLSKMLFGSISSLVLILITIASFIYLIRTILQQKRLAEMKDDFIDSLTHEFKTPIATIAVAIEGLQNFNALNDNEKTERYLTISKNELDRLSNMVTNVLNLASQEKKSVELDLSQINLTTMLNEVIGMEHFRSAKEVKFVVAIDENVNQLRVDPIHFKNVLTNLIDNAVKYANDTVEIVINVTKQDNNAQIVIKDNGIGIPSSALKYVFDKFYRVSNGNIYNVKGIGLGLSYVKSIITAHGGTITVKSEINVGTEFSILIPLN